MKIYIYSLIIISILGLSVFAKDLNVYSQDTMTTSVNLDNEGSQWHTYLEGNPIPIISSATTLSRDGKSLRCGIQGGVPYSNVHCYRNLPAANDSNHFLMELWFMYQPHSTYNNQSAPSVVQGLEFTMNKWADGKRWEWALQWQNVGDGAPQWRYWDYNVKPQWVAFNLSDTITDSNWHHLILAGQIVNGAVFYDYFTIDEITHDLNIKVNPALTPNDPDRLAVAVQVDGNYQEKSYDMYIDNVTLIHSLTAIATPTPISSLNPKIGDANNDNLVNSIDYQIWKCEYINNGVCQAIIETVNYNTHLSADFNQSSGVDLMDFEVWRLNME